MQNRRCGFSVLTITKKKKRKKKEAKRKKVPQNKNNNNNNTFLFLSCRSPHTSRLAKRYGWGRKMEQLWEGPGLPSSLATSFKRTESSRPGPVRSLWYAPFYGQRHIVEGTPIKVRPTFPLVSSTNKGANCRLLTLCVCWFCTGALGLNLFLWCVFWLKKLK